MRDVAVLVPAAGAGVRMGGARKPFARLGDRRVLDWALAPFLAREDVVEAVVAIAAGQSLGEGVAADPRVRGVAGGASRFESVARALDGVRSDAALIAVHDGARPFPPAAVVDRCLRVAATGRGAVAGIRAVDTVKRVVEDGRVAETPDRRGLWYAQTPQAFPRDLFRRAVDEARRAGWTPTDDAALVERIGGTVEMVESTPTNFKLTTPEDAAIASFLARSVRSAPDHG